MRERLEFALQAVWEAGRITLGYYQRQIDVDRKDDDSPVTAADRAAEACLRALINQRFTGEGIWGEEEGVEGPDVCRWIIDPIDGTKSFIAGVPLYAVLLAYEERGMVQVGVAHFPALNETVWATRGGGTYWNGRRRSVSRVNDLSKAIACTGSWRSSRKAGVDYDALGANTAVMRGWGDAYGHILVATGRAEVMVDPVVAYYDVAAVRLIVEEAGGRFSSLSGEITFDGTALSTNGHLHDAALQVMRR